MKRLALMFLCMILIIASVILQSFTYNIKNAEYKRSLENKGDYEQGDILIVVYEFKCKNGVNGFNFEMTYDGDNLDFYDSAVSEGYVIVNRDDSVGRLNVGVMNNKAYKSDDGNKSVKVAVGFKSLYWLEPSYIKFDKSVSYFVDGDLKKSDVYNVSESLYVKKLVEVEDTDSDSECDTDSNTDSDTEMDTDSNTDNDTEMDTDSNTHSDTEIDTDSNTDSESENSSDADIPKPVKYIYGDVDYDGEMTSCDALMTLRYSVKLEDFADIQVQLGDVDFDGSITSNDSIDILRYSVELNVGSAVGEEIYL